MSNIYIYTVYLHIVLFLYFAVTTTLLFFTVLLEMKKYFRPDLETFIQLQEKSLF